MSAMPSDLYTRLRLKGILGQPNFPNVPDVTGGQPADLPDTRPLPSSQGLTDSSMAVVHVPTAVEHLKAVLAEQPTVENYKPSGLRKFGSIMAGIGASASGGGIPGGIATAKAVSEEPFTKDYKSWQSKVAPATQGADIQLNQESVDRGQKQLGVTNALKSQGADTAQERADAAQATADSKLQNVNQQMDLLNKKYEYITNIASNKNSTSEDVAQMRKDAVTQAQELRNEMRQMVMENNNIQNHDKLQAMSDRLDRTIDGLNNRSADTNNTSRQNNQDRINAPKKLNPQEQYSQDLQTDTKLYRSQKGNEDLFEPVAAKGQSGVLLSDSNPFNKPTYYRLKALNQIPSERMGAYKQLLQQRNQGQVPQVNNPQQGRFTDTVSK